MSSVNRGECVTIGGFTIGGLYRAAHLCVAHFELHKKSLFLWGGGDGPCFRR